MMRLSSRDISFKLNNFFISDFFFRFLQQKKKKKSRAGIQDSRKREKKMWNASKLQRPSLPKHLYRDVFDVKHSERGLHVKSNQKEENQTSRIRDENQVLSRLHNSFFSSTRTGIDPKRVPTYSPGPIYEPSVRTVSSRRYDFGKKTDRTGKSIQSRNEKKIVKMLQSRGDRYAVATLPSFRSVIIMMSRIDANPVEIDALYVVMFKAFFFSRLLFNMARNHQ